MKNRAVRPCFVFAFAVLLPLALTQAANGKEGFRRHNVEAARAPGYLAAGPESGFKKVTIGLGGPDLDAELVLAALNKRRSPDELVLVPIPRLARENPSTAFRPVDPDESEPSGPGPDPTGLAVYRELVRLALADAANRYGLGTAPLRVVACGAACTVALELVRSGELEARQILAIDPEVDSLPARDPDAREPDPTPPPGLDVFFLERGTPAAADRASALRERLGPMGARARIYAASLELASLDRILEEVAWAIEGFRVFRMADGKELGFGDLARELVAYDVVFFGEDHDSTATHELELRLLRELHALDPALAVGMEMFERDVQGVLDAYLAGGVDEAGFLAKSRPWPNYAPHYRPIVEFAREQSLPVVAGNVPRRLASKVYREGPGALAALPEEDRVWAARELMALDDRYKADFLETMGAAGDEDEEARASMERMYAAQCLKDDTMAESIADFLDAREEVSLLIHYNGGFHSNRRLGAAQKLARLWPELRIAVLAAEPWGNPKLARAQDAGDGLADYVIFTAMSRPQPGMPRSHPKVEGSSKTKGREAKETRPEAASMASPEPAAPIVEHSIELTLDPASHSIAASDTVLLPESAARSIAFRMSGGLDPKCSAEGVTIERDAAAAEQSQDGIRIERYLVTLPEGERGFRLDYAGVVDSVAEEGFKLSAAAWWYPRIDLESAGHIYEPLLRFTLDTRVPEGWLTVSQGERTVHELVSGLRRSRWECPEPQDEIYLVAGRFHEYGRTVHRTAQGRDVSAMAFLLEADEELAARYLDATGRYLELYGGLLGDYPYAKFALVENVQETGFGMPSFTLLGSKVIRFPWILQSSYPHEVLHNWWGNGVFVDYETGNWCEGLTAYLADHLMKEQTGEGATYRRDQLQAWTDYAAEGDDFPLTAFRSRHSAATQAVGYGKTLLVFHMLRRRLGDEAFIAGLRDFYRANLGRRAGWSDIEDSFLRVSSQDLAPWFAQWVHRTGAPVLRIADAKTSEANGRWTLRVTLVQGQEGDAYELLLPFAVDLDGRDEAFQSNCSMKAQEQTIELDFDARPLRFRLDPEFDVFRKLDRMEVSPALSQAFGAAKLTIILPSAAPAALLEAYVKLAENWQASQPGEALVVRDDALGELPSDRAVWMLGWENRFLPAVAESLQARGAAPDAAGVTLDGTRREASTGVSVVLSGRHPKDPGLPLACCATSNPAAVAGLARKLPHYGKYSWLVFEGDEPSNVAKGQWPVVDAPTIRALSEVAAPAGLARLSPRPALAKLKPSEGAAAPGKRP